MSFSIPIRWCDVLTPPSLSADQVVPLALDARDAVQFARGIPLVAAAEGLGKAGYCGVRLSDEGTSPLERYALQVTALNLLIGFNQVAGGGLLNLQPVQLLCHTGSSGLMSGKSVVALKDMCTGRRGSLPQFARTALDIAKFSTGAVFGALALVNKTCAPVVAVTVGSLDEAQHITCIAYYTLTTVSVAWTLIQHRQTIAKAAWGFMSTLSSWCGGA